MVLTLMVLLPALPASASIGSGGTGFTDVPSNAYYAIPVQWAIQNHITSGTSATTFSPNRTCTRGEVITLLWKTMGSPEPKGRSTFSDVPRGAFYAKAVAWGQENGILYGEEFHPDANCSRQSAVEFLWRNAGRPKARKASFDDADWQSVDWAVEQGILYGTAANKFSPSANCTRGQIITMLYRALAKDIPWYYLFVIFRNVDLRYTNASGKQIRYQSSMTDDEVSLLSWDGQLFANDMYVMTEGIVHAHVDVLVVNTPITFEDLTPYEGTQYKLPAESVRKKLPNTINVDAYDHVTAIADISAEAVGNATYIGLGGGNFGQYTGYTFVRNESTEFTMDRYSQGTCWTSAAFVHEVLHFMDNWGKSLGCNISWELHDVAGHKDTFWDFKDGYAAYMTFNYDLSDGYPGGVPCAIWRRPPWQFRDAMNAQHTHKASFTGTYEPNLGYIGTGKMPVVHRYSDGIYTGQLWGDKRDGYGRMLYNNGTLYRGSWQGSQWDGYGRFEYSDGAVYQGGWKDGIREGWGMIKYADGSSYSGEWKNGQFNGYGKRVYQSGNVYEGEWKDGKKDGFGIFQSSGNTYIGQWKDDKRNSQGMYVWKDGSYYTGGIVNDQLDGYGVAVYSDGTAVPGLWKDGKFAGKTEDTVVKGFTGGIYAGQMRDGKREGYGRLWNNGYTYAGMWKDNELSGLIYRTTPDGTQYFGYYRNNSANGWGVNIFGDYLYIGSHRNGKMDGYGKLIGSSGTFYSGDYVENKRTGYGIYAWPNGNVYEGTFLDSKLDGHGRYYWQCGNVYEGEWKQDRRDGTGIMIYADGRVSAGQWSGNRYTGSSGGEVVSLSNSDYAYTGQRKDGKFDGIGMLEYRDGSVYVGEWVAQERNGYGRVAYVNGNTYAGGWRNDARNGTGKLTWSGGDIFEGEWVDDARRGHGKYIWLDSTIYEGDWQGEAPNGYGSMLYHDGVEEIGQWRDGRYVD